jgi:hypothetical protein
MDANRRCKGYREREGRKPKLIGYCLQGNSKLTGVKPVLNLGLPIE